MLIQKQYNKLILLESSISIERPKTKLSLFFQLCIWERSEWKENKKVERACALSTGNYF